MKTKPYSITVLEMDLWFLSKEEIKFNRPAKGI